MSRVTYNQKGYVGCSMSRGALAAYESGERPKSKWTKALMMQAIADVLDTEEILTEEILNKFAKLNKELLFKMCFYKSSWHHTGKYANCTDFYDVDDSAIYDMAKDPERFAWYYSIHSKKVA